MIRSLPSYSCLNSSEYASISSHVWFGYYKASEAIKILLLFFYPSIGRMHNMEKDISMAYCKTAQSPFLMHWRYCSLALRHRFMAKWIWPSFLSVIRRIPAICPTKYEHGYGVSVHNGIMDALFMIVELSNLLVRAYEEILQNVYKICHDQTKMRASLLYW